MVKDKIGQITIKKVGGKYASCISGTPTNLFKTFKRAEEEVKKMRERYGRRHYNYGQKRIR